MIEVVTLLTGPSNVSGSLQPKLGGNVFVDGPSDFLGATFQCQVSHDGGTTYLPLIDFNRPCSFVLPWCNYARFVCFTGPSGAMANPVATCDLRT